MCGSIDPSGPFVVHVVKVDAAAKAEVDTALAGAQIGTYSTTSRIAADAGAVAAINGDFSGGGMPLDPWAGDGSLLTSGGARNPEVFGLSSDGGGAVSPTGVRVRANDRARRAGVRIARWNTGAPTGDSISGYTTFGDDRVAPPPDACAVRLVPRTRTKWGSGRVGVERDYVVRARRCGAAPMSVRAGSLVLASRETGRGASWIGALSRGGIVGIRWDIGLPGVLDAIGGHPVLLQDRAVMVDTCAAYLCQRHPRTAIGVAEDGTTLMVVVDGRSSASAGMTLTRLATYMRSLGAVDALNLDGGGSSTMWIAGMGVVNEPSSGSERAITNAVVVLRGPDPADPDPSSIWASARSSS